MSFTPPRVNPTRGAHRPDSLAIGQWQQQQQREAFRTALRASGAVQHDVLYDVQRRALGGVFAAVRGPSTLARRRGSRHAGDAAAGPQRRRGVRQRGPSSAPKAPIPTSPCWWPAIWRIATKRTAMR